MEILSWSFLSGARLNAFELSLLDQLEELYFRHFINPKLEEKLAEMRKPKA